MKRNTLRWPFPESLRHRPDIFPCMCDACRDRRAKFRIGNFDGRREVTRPDGGPELGDEFDTHGSGGMYHDGWIFDDTGRERKDRLR